MHKVLIVDDDPIQCRLTSETVSKAGFDPIAVESGHEAMTVLRRTAGIGAMILDLVMPDMDGMAVLEAMKREGIVIPVIVQTAQSSLDTVVSAMRLGASDFFVKPVAPERITISLRNAMKMGTLETTLRAERDKRAGTFGFTHIIGTSAAVGRAIALGKKAATSTIPVLIEGESGTGKEVLARAIQGSGDRAGKPFITVNCGAIPPNLVESILFGHVKGAFTGAVANAPGKFREAHNGTLFLDEVGELPPETQVKLLRALQEGEIEPVGASKPVKVNVRVISATNRRLLNLAKEGHFREDLYYRLNVFPIYMPPLRDRREDIPALVEHFIARFAAEEGRRVSAIDAGALEMLTSHDWPGNIRQLENAIFRAVVLAETTTLRPADFPQILAAVRGPETARSEAAQTAAPAAPIHIDNAPPLPRLADINPASIPDRFLDKDGNLLPLAEIEKDLIAFAIDFNAGRMAQVARQLGIGRSTLYRKLKEYGLDGSEGSNVA
ncbi:sigma-54-dependent transcriptional regulator [Pelagibacterium xiamenense]|uniref:sigma-54-dependent transcriptional regulator n=1 Tax=Pelagibacterium xiamenense TaxID=2901140 RepID=UPI001E463F49|nr:sigma-54 dependent transcriptional regulator [Pelagibacterium xiamenense]MCD7060508.1 sigma-54 dependent transcriptional regulator [Pelagibacterium xiamenense]